MAFRRLLSSGLVLTLLMLSGKAPAQTSAAKRETARELMVEGRQLREHGDLAGALSRFRAADAIMNVPTTAFEVAATQAELGQLIDARESLLRLLGTPEGPADPEPFIEARAKARGLSEQLLARLGSIVFTANVTEADELDLRIDGETVPRAMLGIPFRVNPGHHQIVARSHGRDLWSELEVAEGQVLEAPLSFGETPVVSAKRQGPAATPRALERATHVADSTPDSRPQSNARSLAHIGVGLGGVGLAIGTAAGISAIVHKSSAERGCIQNACPPSTWRDLRTAQNMATTSDVGFVIGGAGLALAIGSRLWERRGQSQQGWLVTPEVSRQSAGMNVARRF